MWKTIDEVKAGQRIAIFRKFDNDRDQVLFTSVRRILRHLPFFKTYSFLSKDGKKYDVVKIR